MGRFGVIAVKKAQSQGSSADIERLNRAARWVEINRKRSSHLLLRCPQELSRKKDMSDAAKCRAAENRPHLTLAGRCRKEGPSQATVRPAGQFAVSRVCLACGLLPSQQ